MLWPSRRGILLFLENMLDYYSATILGSIYSQFTYFVMPTRSMILRNRVYTLPYVRSKLCISRSHITWNHTYRTVPYRTNLNRIFFIASIILIKNRMYFGRKFRNQTIFVWYFHTTCTYVWKWTDPHTLVTQSLFIRRVFLWNITYGTGTVHSISKMTYFKVDLYGYSIIIKIRTYVCRYIDSYSISNLKLL